LLEKGIEGECRAGLRVKGIAGIRKKGGKKKKEGHFPSWREEKKRSQHLDGGTKKKEAAGPQHTKGRKAVRRRLTGFSGKKRKGCHHLRNGS